MRTYRVLFLAVILLLAVGRTPTLAAASLASHSVQSLAGAWRFALDRDDIGVQAQWFERTLPDHVRLPGSLPEQGIGDPPSLTTPWTGEGIPGPGADEGLRLLQTPSLVKYSRPDQFKMIYSLTPTRIYVGPAWYQRDLNVPAAWAGQRLVLSLERVHWQTMVWVDGQPCGARNALGMPHEYDLTDVLTPGRHVLTIRVDNRLQVPHFDFAHSVTDNTQGNWNGLIGALTLRAMPRLWVDGVQVRPDVTHRAIRVSVRLGNLTGAPGRGALTVRVDSYNTPRSYRAPPRQVAVSWTSEGGDVEFDYPLGQDAQLWDEFAPALYRLTLAGVGEPYTVTFGLRELGIKGTQFTLNDRVIFLRGTLECAIFPRTGHPPMDVAAWKRIMKIARAHGLNHLRFHSWTPPAAAFIAADELGMYLQVELTNWSDFGQGGPLDTWIYDEAARVVQTYGNHPSFLFLVAGNESGGTDTFLNNWVTYWKRQDRRRLYSMSANGNVVAANDFFITPQTRLGRFLREGLPPPPPVLDEPPQTTFDYSAVVRQWSLPVISHEMGQWGVYPDFREIPKYRGGVMQPGNLEIFRDLLNRRGLGAQAHAFMQASGALQKLLYKADIEAALRTPGLAGFQLLGLQDYPGFGSAYVGLLNAFWEEKGYSSAEAFRRFSSATVPLARMPKLVFTSADQFTAVLDIAHYGAADLPAVRAQWRIFDAAARAVAHGELPAHALPTGTLTAVGEIRVPLARFTQATQLTLEVTLPNVGAVNAWDFWVFPADQTITTPPEIHVAETLDSAARAVLQASGRVLLIPGSQRIAAQTLGAFRPIFWSRLLFSNDPHHTLGLLIDQRHPALKSFPTETHSNWQWWDLTEHSKPMVLDALPTGLRPIIQPIDDWAAPRKLGLLIEARVGGGRLLLCSIDLQSQLAQRPAARQLRRSLLAYMDSTVFRPAIELSLAQINSLLTDAPQ